VFPFNFVSSVAPFLLSVFSVFSVTTKLFAQAPAAPYVDKPVASVAITVEGKPNTDAALKDPVQIKVGAPLKMSDVRETMTHLYTLGRFEDVRVEAEDAPNGAVAILIALEPVHVVTKVEFRGQLGMTEGALRDRMADRFGATPPVVQAPDVAANLQQYYRDEGYLTAVVRPGAPAIAHDPERATLVFDITAGPRVRIARAIITGTPLEAAARVEERLRIQPGAAYAPGHLRGRMADYIQWMRHQGYYQADARDMAPVFNADRTEVELTVDVQAGPRVTVEFTGDPLPKDKQAELVPIEREGSVDQDLLEDSAQRIRDYLQQQGYWKADVNPPARRNEDSRLILTFNIVRGPLYRVGPGGLKVEGNLSVGIEELRPMLRIAPKDPFVAQRLAAIESAIKGLYRTKGFATADVTSDVAVRPGNLVEPVITIKEGPRVVVGSIAVKGNEKLKTEDLLSQISLKVNDPYYRPTVVGAGDAIQVYYLNLGFASAEVSLPPQPAVTPGPAAKVDVVFQIKEGPQTLIEHIFITGNLKTKNEVIQRELRIHEGGPLGYSDVADSRRNLSALGLFRRITIAGVSHGDPTRSDVVVSVEEAQRTTTDYGGGLQIDKIRRASEDQVSSVDVFEAAPRGFFEIGRRNLGGKNRSVNLYTRLSLRPNSDPDNSNPFGFAEYRVVGTYREPRAFQNFGELTGTAAIEQGVRTGFNFIRKGFNGELTHPISAILRGSGRYSFTTTKLVDVHLGDEQDQLNVDRVFSQVRLSSFGGTVSRDTRDDILEPRKGALLSGDATLAARLIGSEVGFAKIFLQGFLYRNVGWRNVVFAGGARLGVSRAFLRTVTETDANGNSVIVEVRDLPASERFFAGGDTTIRGFARDTVGRPETITLTGFPKGGDAEVIFNAELRVPVTGRLGAVFFTDAGNVFKDAADLDLGDLRASLGFGMRINLPFGPIRVDLGFPVQRQIIGGKLEPRFVPHFSIGHAF